MQLSAEPPTVDAVLSGRARVPAHVVFRAFAHETVVLNLDTGKYHGLNPTAGHMLEAVDKADSVELAAARLTEEYGRDGDEIRRDLYDLCVELQARGLLEILSNDGHTG